MCLDVKQITCEFIRRLKAKVGFKPTLTISFGIHSERTRDIARAGLQVQRRAA
jgi:hypothetical protein